MASFPKIAWISFFPASSFFEGSCSFKNSRYALLRFSFASCSARTPRSANVTRARLIVRWRSLATRRTAAVIDSLQGVRSTSNVAVGFDNIDVAAATRKGILVTNTPDVLTDTTADFAWALLMAAARRVVEGHQYVHSGQWRKWYIDLLVGHDVHHRTIGIFGMGRIGQAMARRAGGFSMRILYHDAVRAPEALEKSLALEFASAEDLLRQ